MNRPARNEIQPIYLLTANCGYIEEEEEELYHTAPIRHFIIYLFGLFYLAPHP
jgi:hypothetical protein